MTLFATMYYSVNLRHTYVLTRTQARLTILGTYPYTAHVWLQASNSTFSFRVKLITSFAVRISDY